MSPSALAETGTPGAVALERCRADQLREQVEHPAAGTSAETREALEQQLQAVEAAEAEHGPEHPRTAVSLFNLARVYEAAGHYAEAEMLYGCTLTIEEAALGPEHLAVAAQWAGARAVLATLWPTRPRRS